MKPNEKDKEALFVEEGEQGLRLDQILGARYKGLFSRTYFQQLIEQGLVLLNGEPVKKRIIPAVGDEIEVAFVLPPQIDLTPENIPLDVLYEDEAMIAINKPAGMVVHPAPGNYRGTFVQALLYHTKIESDDSLRPGIVHRLDKDTTGVLIAAKTYEAQVKLVEAFSSREIKKEYLAVVHGYPKEGKVVTHIGRDPKNRQKMANLQEGGKEAISLYRTLERKGPYSLVSVDLITGRTHQIRLHMSYLNCPIVGDPLYGSDKVNREAKALRQLLHAHRVDLQHPITKRPLSIVAPLPADFVW